jgi:hypothetical protein
MKKLLVLALFLFTYGASAQVQNMYSKSGDASSSWTTIQKSNYQNIFSFEIANDSTSGTDSLFVAFETDTSVARRFYLLYEETMYFSNLSVSQIMIRSSSGDNAIPYRLRYH